eukprot:2956414-Amphidinium_carterae.1
MNSRPASSFSWVGLAKLCGSNWGVPLTLPEVLKEEMATAKKNASEMDATEQKHLHVLSLLSLRRVFVRDLTEVETEIRDTASASIDAGAKRKANKEYLQQFEHAMQEGMQTTLAEFKPVSRFLPLSGLEERAYKPTETGHTALRIRENELVEPEIQYTS